MIGSNRNDVGASPVCGTWPFYRGALRFFATEQVVSVASVALIPLSFRLIACRTCECELFFPLLQVTFRPVYPDT